MFHVIAFVVVPSLTLPVSAMHRPTLYISTVSINPKSADFGQGIHKDITTFEI
jgi:hypothetical protein